MRKYELCYSDFECLNLTNNIDSICDECQNREIISIDNDDLFKDLTRTISEKYTEKYDSSNKDLHKKLITYSKFENNYDVCVVEKLVSSVTIYLFRLTNRTLDSINKNDLFESIGVIIYDELDVNKFFQIYLK